MKRVIVALSVLALASPALAAEEAKAPKVDNNSVSDSKAHHQMGYRGKNNTTENKALSDLEKQQNAEFGPKATSGDNTKAKKK